MTVQSPFQPTRGANQKVTATTVTASIAIGKGNKSLRVINAGTVVGYFRTYATGDGSGTSATAGDTPVAVAGAAGSVLIIEKPEAHDQVAYLSDSATTVMHFQPGEGGS
jgi:hypothetical protein